MATRTSKEEEEKEKKEEKEEEGAEGDREEELKEFNEVVMRLEAVLEQLSERVEEKGTGEEKKVVNELRDKLKQAKQEQAIDLVKKLTRRASNLIDELEKRERRKEETTVSGKEKEEKESLPREEEDIDRIMGRLESIMVPPQSLKDERERKKTKIKKDEREKRKREEVARPLSPREFPREIERLQEMMEQIQQEFTMELGKLKEKVAVLSLNVQEIQERIEGSASKNEPKAQPGISESEKKKKVAELVKEFKRKVQEAREVLSSETNNTLRGAIKVEALRISTRNLISRARDRLSKDKITTLERLFKRLVKKSRVYRKNFPLPVGPPESSSSL